MDTIGQRIATARESVGLSAAELSRALNISRAALSNIESGITKSPTASNLYKISIITGHDLSWLITGIGPATTKEKQKHIRDTSKLTAEQRAVIDALIQSFKKP